MAGALRIVLEVSVLVFPVSSLLAAGLAHTMAEVTGPLRDPRRILRALVANFVLVPAFTFGLTQLLSLDRPLELGLMLISTGAGAPFLIKLTRAAGGDVALSAALLLVLVPATVVFMPLVVPWIEPSARVGAGAIALPLALTLVVPLVLGLWLRAQRPRAAAWLGPKLGKLSTLSLGALLVSTAISNLRHLPRLFASGGAVGAVLLVVGAFLIGFLVARPSWSARVSLGLGTAQRNIAAAAVVASQSFHDPDTLLMVVVASLLDLLVLFPIAWVLRQRDRHHPHEFRREEPARA